MPEEEMYYVGIGNATELRKYLLSSTKDLIFLMQKKEKITGLRKEKLDAVHQMKKILSEIAELSIQLKKELPKVTSAPPVLGPAKEAKNQGEPFASSDIDRLDRELEELEAKLRQLE